LTAGKEISTL